MSLAYTIGDGAGMGAGVGTSGIGDGMNRVDDAGAEVKSVPIFCAMSVDVDVA